MGKKFGELGKKKKIAENGKKLQKMGNKFGELGKKKKMGKLGKKKKIAKLQRKKKRQKDYTFFVGINRKGKDYQDLDCSKLKEGKEKQLNVLGCGESIIFESLSFDSRSSF